MVVNHWCFAMEEDEKTKTGQVTRFDLGQMLKAQTRMPDLGLNCDPGVAPTPDRPPGVGRPLGRGLLSRRLSQGLQYHKGQLFVFQLRKCKKITHVIITPPLPLPITTIEFSFCRHRHRKLLATHIPIPNHTRPSAPLRPPQRRAMRGRIMLLLALALTLTAEPNPTTPSSTSGENGLRASMDGALPFTKLELTATSLKTGVVNADLEVFAVA